MPGSSNETGIARSMTSVRSLTDQGIATNCALIETRTVAASSTSFRKTGMFFPAPKPQETLYSLCARYCAASSAISDQAASLHLVGHMRGGFHHELPYGLDQLQAVSNGQIAVSPSLLRERTVLGCVLPFMSSQVRRSVLDRMRVSSVPKTSRRMIGLSWAGHDAQHFLRSCPDCSDSDRSAYGFAYWHTEHQFLGVWTCPFHGRPLLWLPNQLRSKYSWRQAERDTSDFCETSADASTLLKLDALAKTVCWTASMESLSCVALNILVRSRLRRLGFVHTEIKINDSEIRRIHEALACPLAKSGISHFTRFTSPDWIGETLKDPRASHPLRWAMLVATTLGDDLFCSHSDGRRITVRSSQSVAELLSIEYRLACERVPQPSLFSFIHAPRIARAPSSLYRALGQTIHLADAAASVGLSLNEARIWVRRDAKLAAHWHRSIATARVAEASAQIRAFLQLNPKAKRVDLLRGNTRAVRLLERYDQALLESLLPVAWAKFDRQQCLPFDS